MSKPVFKIINCKGDYVDELSIELYVRVISERYRDHFRKALSGTTRNFFKKYGPYGWTPANFKLVQHAIQNTPRYNIDHLIPLDFWSYYKNGKYISFCIHPENINIVSADHNNKKRNKLPCRIEYNQKYMNIILATGVIFAEFTNSLYLFETNRRAFDHDINYEEVIRNTAVSRDASEDFTKMYDLMTWAD